MKYSISQARKDLPLPRRTANKTRGGKCLILAGSQGMWGAAILCAEAAARSGAGYVYLYKSEKKSFPVARHPDFLLATDKQIQDINFDSVAMGPGFKDSRAVKIWLKNLLMNKIQHVVLDAEAINFLAKQKRQIKLPGSWILTPHEGELARLLKVSSRQIKAHREKYARLAQQKWGCIVLLKGHRTLVVSDDKVFEIQSGNAALAKAGTGDVLTGMIAAFLAQQVSPVRAACLASYIHGRMADEWISGGNDILSLIASDLIKALPATMARIRRKTKA